METLPVVKGVLTWIPAFDIWRKHHATTGGTDTPRYCYAVWLRHLKLLNICGFKIGEARVDELGPADSIGIGLAALFSGARYTGLDSVRFLREMISADFAWLSSCHSSLIECVNIKCVFYEVADTTSKT